MQKLPKISQSLMKSYVDYLNQKECGLFFKARYIDKDPDAQTEPSEAMKHGIFFEYLCTGALPKSGEIPEPDVVYKGKPNEKLAAPYERATQSAELFKAIIKHYNITIKSVGLYLEHEDMNGIVDIHAEWDGKDVFIDLKYSGLIDDKWSEMGWDLDSLHMKDSLMIQGVHYKLLAEKCMGITDIPFYYFVFSSSDPNNIKIIRQEVDESKAQSHLVAKNNVLSKITKDVQYGFKPYPSMLKCSKCPLNFKCQSKVDYPLIDEVYY
jgi:hypothetical protein